VRGTHSTRSLASRLEHLHLCAGTFYLVNDHNTSSTRGHHSNTGKTQHILDRVCRFYKQAIAWRIVPSIHNLLRMTVRVVGRIGVPATMKNSQQGSSRRPCASQACRCSSSGASAALSSSSSSAASQQPAQRQVHADTGPQMTLPSAGNALAKRSGAPRRYEMHKLSRAHRTARSKPDGLYCVFRADTALQG
jgi:hypothetical protein